MELFLIRHGLTDWNRERVCQGQTDVPLNDEGRDQARKLGARLAKVNFDAAFSSDLSRAHETAQIALADRGLDITINPMLREMAFGEWEGQHLAELFTRLPEERAKWLEDPGAWQPPGGECLATVQERMSRCLDELWARSDEYERVVVFSHGFAILTYICAVIGTPLQRFRQLWMHSTGITELTHISGRIVVKRLNDHSHLED